MEKSIKLTVRAGNTWKISRIIKGLGDADRALEALCVGLFGNRDVETVTVRFNDLAPRRFDACVSGDEIFDVVASLLKSKGMLPEKWDTSPEHQPTAQTADPLAEIVFRQAPATADPAFLKAVDRLEKEEKELRERWEREGAADGREWALQASFEDLETVTDAARYYLDCSDPIGDEGLPADVITIIREEMALKEEPALDRGEYIARISWRFGWLAGITEAGEDIFDEMYRRLCAREEGRADHEDHFPMNISF